MAEMALAEVAGLARVETDALQEAQRRPAAFPDLYARHVGPVHRYIYSRVCNRTDAKDVTAELPVAKDNALSETYSSSVSE